MVPPTHHKPLRTMGALLLRDQLMDQNGQVVDLYDFAGHGKHVVVVISAMWSRTRSHVGRCHHKRQ